MVTTSREIAAALLDRVAEGRLRPGESAPTEDDVAREWNVSWRVASDSLRHLIVRGVFLLGRPTGYVVASGAADGPLTALGPGSAVPGARESTEIVATGTVDVGDVDPWVAGAAGMGRSIGDGLYRRRLLRRDGRSRCVVTSWFAITVLSTQPGCRDVERRLLSSDLIPDGTPRLIGVLVREEESIRDDNVAVAGPALQEDSELLGLEPGAHVLRVMTTTSSASWPLECTVRTYAPGVPCPLEAHEPRL